MFVANDPYHGGGHLPDYNVFAPVHGPDGELLLIPSIQCHHGDTGGAVPGGYNVTANDIWGEGVRWPVVKVIDQGRERRDVLYALATNNRLPGFVGDIRAQIGAAQLAVRRLGDIVARYGADTVEGVGRLHDRLRVAPVPRGSRGVARRRVRRRRVRRPRSPRNPDIHIHVQITVDGSRLRIDYTGSDTRPEIQAWSTFGNTRGYTIAQIASMMDPDIPKNEGFFESIELDRPAGLCAQPASEQTRVGRYAPPRRRHR